MKPIQLLFAAMGFVTLIATTPTEASTLTRSNATAERRLDQCSWDRPGVDPFMGDVVAAVDHYRDIAPETREKLKARMAKRQYDEIVSIERDGIRGKSTYGTTIRDMHFGTNQVCSNVTRASWRADTKERGLVYCEGRECILVPTVCRNVSRVSRAEVMSGTATDGEGGPATAMAAPAVLVAEPETEPAGGEPISGGVAFGPGEPRSFALLSGNQPGGLGPDRGSPFGPYPGSPNVQNMPAKLGEISPIGQLTPVPEPQSLLLMAAGLAGFAWTARRRAARRQ